jgi:NADPH-dependent 7-cyano-7-deazaguanine reductase QueF-like protein
MGEKKIKEIILSKTYPKYKNFDYTKQYDITLLFDMHHVIISVINELIQTLKNRNDRVSSCKKHSEGGVNLLQLINVQTYNNNLINSKIEMFLNCLDSINVNHTYFFENMMSKLKLCNNTPICRGLGVAGSTDISFSSVENVTINDHLVKSLGTNN